MPKNFTYSDAGVNREQRHESKKHLKTLEETYSYSSYGSVMCLPYGNIFPVGRDAYLGIVVTAMGTALKEARAGELVKVRNADSRRVILCRVKNDGTVEPIL